MLSREATVSAQGTLAQAIATIVGSGVFDLAFYRLTAGLPPDTTLETAIADYLSRGGADGLRPHDLFVPAHVRRQLHELGISLVGDSVLLTYLSYPGAPLDPHPLFDY